VTLTFEVLNRYEEAMINTAARAREYVEVAGSPHLGIHLDTFHMAIEEADMADAVRRSAPRMRFLELGQSARGDLATGAVDVPAILRAAWGAGYRGRIGVEGFSRAINSEAGANRLAVWRAPFDDGLAFAARAIALVHAAARS
jgi:D-psicose/D-tagatose/L-ribulose 3-epimerase